jgi:hypothetical protein
MVCDGLGWFGMSWDWLDWWVLVGLGWVEMGWDGLG